MLRPFRKTFLLLTALYFALLQLPAHAGPEVETRYVDAWQDGYSLFPSRAQKAAFGIERHPALASDRRDLLEEALIDAHRAGQGAFVRFRFPAVARMAGQGGAVDVLRAKKAGWLLHDASGADVGPDGAAWLNPGNPEVRAYLRDMLFEALRSNDIDGLQFDAQATGPETAAILDDATRAQFAALQKELAAEVHAQWPGLAISFGAEISPRTDIAARGMPVTLWRMPLRSNILRDTWKVRDLKAGRYSMIGRRGNTWEVIRDVEQDRFLPPMTETVFFESTYYQEVELLPNRRLEMRRAPRP